MSDEQHYTVEDEAKVEMKKIIESIVATKDDNFGNARVVRNLFETIIANQANRLVATGDMSPEALNTIKVEDIVG